MNEEHITQLMIDENFGRPDFEEIVWNSDNQDMWGGDIEVEVFGPGGQEIPGFLMTRWELLIMVKYWATRALQSDFDFYITGSITLFQANIMKFAKRRIRRIASLLGQDRVTKAIADAYTEMAGRYPGPEWAEFRCQIDEPSTGSLPWLLVDEGLTQIDR